MKSAQLGKKDPRTSMVPGAKGTPEEIKFQDLWSKSSSSLGMSSAARLTNMPASQKPPQPSVVDNFEALSTVYEKKCRQYIKIAGLQN